MMCNTCVSAAGLAVFCYFFSFLPFSKVLRHSLATPSGTGNSEKTIAVMSCLLAKGFTFSAIAAFLIFSLESLGLESDTMAHLTGRPVMDRSALPTALLSYDGLTQRLTPRPDAVGAICI